MQNLPNLAQTLLDNIPDQAWLKDIDSRYVAVNEAFARDCGLGKQEVVGSYPQDVWPADWGSEYLRTDSLVVQTGRRWRYEETRRTREGQQLWFETIKSPIRDEAGRIVGTVGISRDITDRKRTESELRELSLFLQRVREEERSRIARELHDELGQSLTAIQLGLGAISNQPTMTDESRQRRLTHLMSLTEHLISRVQKIATELRPPVLDGLGLISAVHWLIGTLQETSAMRFHFEHSGTDTLIPDDASTAIFRVAQEAITNACRHSRAQVVETHLEFTEQLVRLKIQDDGCGFETGHDKSGMHLGLIGMRERITALGGKFELGSSPGKGTTVLAELPLEKTAHAQDPHTAG